MLIPRSSLIAGPGGTTHAASLSGNPCVDDQIAAYLATGALPPRLPGRRADAFCPPLAPPVPGGGGESAAAAAAAAASGAPSPALRQLLRDRAGPSRLVG